MKSFFSKQHQPISYDLLKSFEMIDDEEITRATNDKIFIEDHDLMVGIDGTVMPYSYHNFRAFAPFVAIIQREKFTPEVLKSVLQHFNPECLFEEFRRFYPWNYDRFLKSDKQSLRYPFIEQMIQRWGQADTGYETFHKIMGTITFNKITKFLDSNAYKKEQLIEQWYSLLDNWDIDKIYSKGSTFIAAPLEETLSQRALLVSKLAQIFDQKNHFSPASRDNLYLFLRYPHAHLASVSDRNSKSFESEAVKGAYSPIDSTIFIKHYSINNMKHSDYEWKSTLLHELEHFASDVGYGYGCGDSPLHAMINLRLAEFRFLSWQGKESSQIIDAFEKDLLSLETAYLARIAQQFSENKRKDPNYTYLGADNIKEVVDGSNIRDIPVTISENNLHLFSKEIQRAQAIENGLIKVKFNERYSDNISNRKVPPSLLDIIYELHDQKLMIWKSYSEIHYPSEIFARIAEYGFPDELSELLFPKTSKKMKQWQPCINKALERFVFDAPPVTPFVSSRLLPDRCINTLPNSQENTLLQAYRTGAPFFWGAYLSFLGMFAFKWIKRKMQHNETESSTIDAVIVDNHSIKEENLSLKKETVIASEAPQEPKKDILYWQNQEQLRRRQSAQSQAMG